MSPTCTKIMDRLRSGPVPAGRLCRSARGPATYWLRLHGYIEIINIDGQKCYQIVPPERGFRGLV